MWEACSAVVTHVLANKVAEIETAAPPKGRAAAADRVLIDFATSVIDTLCKSLPQISPVLKSVCKVWDSKWGGRCQDALIARCAVGVIVWAVAARYLEERAAEQPASAELTATLGDLIERAFRLAVPAGTAELAGAAIDPTPLRSVAEELLSASKASRLPKGALLVAAACCFELAQDAAAVVDCLSVCARFKELLAALARLAPAFAAPRFLDALELCVRLSRYSEQSAQQVMSVADHALACISGQAPVLAGRCGSYAAQVLGRLHLARRLLRFARHPHVLLAVVTEALDCGAFTTPVFAARALPSLRRPASSPLLSASASRRQRWRS